MNARWDDLPAAVGRRGGQARPEDPAPPRRNSHSAAATNPRQPAPQAKLVGPILEQARVAADTLLGREAAYRGSVPSAKLKVAGVDLVAIGKADGEAAGVSSDRAGERSSSSARRPLTWLTVNVQPPQASASARYFVK